MEACIYHKDKVTFKAIENDLHRMKLLSRNLSHRLAMAVCSCRKKRQTTIPTDEKEFSFLREKVTGYLKQHKWSPPCSSILPALYSDSEVSTSARRLVYVIGNALKGDYSMLTEEKKTSSKRDGSEDRKRTLKPREKEMMLKRMKRKSKFQTTLEIPTGRGFVSARRLITSVNRLSREHKCVIEMKGLGGGHLIVVKIWSTCLEKTEAVQRELRTVTGSYVSARVGNVRQEVFNKDTGASMFKYCSEENTAKYYLNDHFIDKVLDRKRYNVSRTPQRRIPDIYSSILCERCQQPFTEVFTHNLPCYFHTGNMEEIKGRKSWTCCKAEATGGSISEEYLKTGCLTASHLWNTESILLATKKHREIPRLKYKPRWTVVGYIKAF